VRWLITMALGAIFTLTPESAEQPATIPALRCTACGGPMCLVGFAPALMPAVFDTR
jgi:hypothetical protein